MVDTSDINWGENEEWDYPYYTGSPARSGIDTIDDPATYPSSPVTYPSPVDKVNKTNPSLPEPIPDVNKDTLPSPFINPPNTTGGIITPTPGIVTEQNLGFNLTDTTGQQIGLLDGISPFDDKPWQPFGEGFANLTGNIANMLPMLLVMGLMGGRRNNMMQTIMMMMLLGGSNILGQTNTPSPDGNLF